MARTTELDRNILEAALEGLEQRLAAINEQIAQVKSRLSGRQPKHSVRAEAGPAAKPVRKKRRMSAAARKRIAEAQRLRWQQFRAQQQKASAKRGKTEEQSE